MKKIIAVLLASVILVVLAACSDGASSKTSSGTKTVDDVLNGEETTAVSEQKGSSKTNGSGASSGEAAEIDLTEMNATMIYSQVLEMTNYPKKYIGKTVRMFGSLVSTEYKGNIYYACIIKDATACCQQGIEFVLDEGEYPADGTDIVVYGVFNTYEEEGNTYCQLKNARLESQS